MPIGGLVIAFQKFNLYAGITGSPFVGLKNFIDLFTSRDLWKLIRNTVLLGTYVLLCGIPIPILFAIALNEIKVVPVKKFVQSVSYIPALISVVVVASLITDFLSPSTGIINTVLAAFGFEKHYFMTDPRWFRRIYVISDVWQNFGYNAVIYFSAISSISTELYEAAEVDGCSRLKRIWHITLPGILPTICTMTILNAGTIFKIGADKALLLYNPLTYETADIFGTFVYRRGLIDGNYSYSAAAGMFESVVAFAVVMLTNWLSKRMSENSLW
jgi:putative aldouronate transport system permease protein